ncbi:MAG: DUF739 family protein [Ruminococcaceae bacterium]|nr:DUF739 family protein [Oscillospiraceae bacterium]
MRNRGNNLMLENLISKRGYSIPYLAKELGISEKTLKSKLERKTKFKVGEVLRISLLLKLNCNEISNIFFK